MTHQVVATAGHQHHAANKGSGPHTLTHQEADEAGAADTAVVVGSAKGKLHCVSCSSGQQLWVVDLPGSGISTAATCLQMTSSYSHASRDAKTVVQSEEGPDAQTQPQKQTKSREQLHLESQPQLSRMMATCTNNGVLRIIRAPQATPAIVVGSSLEASITHAHAARTKTATSSRAGTSVSSSGRTHQVCSDEEQTVAAVQMPGMQTNRLHATASLKWNHVLHETSGAMWTQNLVHAFEAKPQSLSKTCLCLLHPTKLDSAQTLVNHSALWQLSGYACPLKHVSM